MSDSRNRKGILTAPIAVFSSLRLTVVLLGLCMILIFAATLLQVEQGIHEVQLRYFRAWIAWFDVAPGGKHFPIPFPGGMLLGTLLLLNLLAAHIRRFKLRWEKAGMILVHSGIVLMLLGELFTAVLSVESQMRLDEGQTSNYSVSPRETELVVIGTDGSGSETVNAIPFDQLKDDADFPFDGFSLRIVRFFRNCEIQDARLADAAFDPTRADKGMGVSLAVREKTRETAMDLRDLTSAFVEIESADGKTMGRWLLSNTLPSEQEFVAAGKTWKMAIRQRRFYHPFSIRLLDFTHDRYLGTQIPKNFSSRIRLLNPEEGEDRETLIYMNHPLRYGGLTFYQAGFENDDQTTILQVVRNPAWTMPYISCIMVGIGLVWIFSQHLAKAFARSRNAKAMEAKGGLIPRLIPALCLLAFSAWLAWAIRPSKGFDVKGFGTIPVVSNGRIQPLDSLARNSLLSIQGKQRVPGKNPPSEPAAWLAELTFNPQGADQRPIFQINHDEVLGQFKLKQEDGRWFSFLQLVPRLGEVSREATRIATKDSKTWSPYEKSFMQLWRNLGNYQQLKFSIAHPESSGLESDLTLLVEKASEAQADEAAARMQVLTEWSSQTEVFTMPPTMGGLAAEWKKLPDAAVAAIAQGTLDPSTLALARVGDAFRSGDVKRFNTTVSGYLTWFGKNRAADLRKTRAEALFNRIAPFYLCMFIYSLAFLCALISWMWSGSALRRAGFRVLLIGLAIHTAGLVVRMALEGRPPVTNLYSSAIFIGWAAICLSMLLELFYKNAIGTAVAAIIGFATLIIAHHLSLSGDTLEMMRAVLDTNFWLATHVVIITLGYAATFLAGIIAIVYIVIRLSGNMREEIATPLRGMVYGIICFATLASFVGTVLGGIWADQSWGRFWGWDPKENGALLIVIWNAIILHARWGGLVKERGMMVMAVFGNIVTSWSWFGTNMLGIGLHSYGFTDAAFFWLSAFIISQLVVMAVAYIPKRCGA